jgi:hypothetical protein
LPGGRCAASWAAMAPGEKGQSWRAKKKLQPHVFYGVSRCFFCLFPPNP